MPYLFLSKKDILAGITILLISSGSAYLLESAALAPITFLTLGGLWYRDRPKSILQKDQFIRICKEIYISDQPERLICEILDPLTVEEKIQLLTQLTNHPQPISQLENLLDDREEACELILKSLFKGLSSIQCINVISQTFVPRGFCNAWMIMPGILKIFFENVTLEDRYTFLTLNKHNMPIFIHLIINACAAEESDLFDATKMIEFFINDLSIEQLNPLLAYKWKWKSSTTDCGACSDTIRDRLQNHDLTALYVAMLYKENNLVNLLLEQGAIKADPECDFEALTLYYNLNITPYRNKLNEILKKSTHLIDPINDLVLDYLIVEPPPKAKSKT